MTHLLSFLFRLTSNTMRCVCAHLVLSVQPSFINTVVGTLPEVLCFARLVVNNALVNCILAYMAAIAVLKALFAFKLKNVWALQASDQFD